MLSEKEKSAAELEEEQLEKQPGKSCESYLNECREASF